jgi:hypothetical protein
VGDVGFVDCQEKRKRKEEIRNMCVNKEVSLCGVSFVGSAFPLVSFGADTLKPHAVTCPRISIFPLLLFLFRLFFFYGSFILLPQPSTLKQSDCHTFAVPNPHTSLLHPRWTQTHRHRHRRTDTQTYRHTDTHTNIHTHIRTQSQSHTTKIPRPPPPNVPSRSSHFPHRIPPKVNVYP